MRREIDVCYFVLHTHIYPSLPLHTQECFLCNQRPTSLATDRDPDRCGAVW